MSIWLSLNLAKDKLTVHYAIFHVKDTSSNSNESLKLQRHLISICAFAPGPAFAEIFSAYNASYRGENYWPIVITEF